MRGLALLPLLACFGANAQNWALLNPAYKYNYSNDGSDTISNQLFVTHIDTLGPDSFRYELNRIGEVEVNDDGSTACDGQMNAYRVRIETAQFCGASVIRANDAWLLEREDTLIIHPSASPGSTWTGVTGIEATVLSSDTTTLFEQSDSVKWIGYSNGDTLRISKDHGLISFGPMSVDDTRYELKGIGGAIEQGASFPDHRSLFNYQIGDVLQYQEHSEYLDGGDCYNHSNTTAKYTVIDRIDLPTRTEYAMRRVAFLDHWSFYVFDMTPCDAYTAAWVDTLSVGVEHSEWTADNPFCSSWKLGTWPNAVTPSTLFLDTRVLLKAALGTDGRYTLEANKLVAPDQPYSLLCANAQDTGMWLITGGAVFESEFRDGIGLTFENVYSFESGGSRVLEGYLINGVQSGTLTPDGVLLGVFQESTKPSLQIIPNPTADLLTLQLEAPMAGDWRIVTTNGAVLMTGSVRHERRQGIDVSALAEGVYVLDLTTSLSRVAQRFIIAR